MTLSSGTRLGPYEILSPLGAGGMGEVYRARDSKLRREVAIKVLPESLAGDPEALARFEREAQAVAALSHPNILAIHDFGTQDGTAYAVMELLEGETLGGKVESGPIPQKQAVDWALQVAKGLSAAHGKGVVHRDLKPDNVFVTRDGHVKILDFGLAKRVEASPAEQTSAPTGTGGGHTEPGTVMGTMGYMSPEQLRGQPVDHRTDIFSFGTILYELLSGQKAFRRSTASDTIAAILMQEPPELTQSGRNISPALGNVVKHCLEKDRESRFQTAKDIAFALSEASSPTAAVTSGAQAAAVPRANGRLWVAAAVVVVLAAVGLFLWKRPRGSATSEGPRRIAVLPFENLGSPEDDYFADGVADEVRGKLTSVPGLQVIARGSSTPYKKTTKTPKQISEELDASYLLTATVRWEKSGGTSRVHVSPELVEISGSGAPTSKWQQPFDASLTDVFQVQADIASKVAEALGVALAEGQKKQLSVTPTQNLTAYDAYLKGEEASGGLTRVDITSLKKAVAFYAQAVALDPGFAPAWARLASANSVWYSESATTELAESTREAAQKAVALAPDRPEGHLALAEYYLEVLNEPQRALAEYEKGLRLAPGDPALIRGVAIVDETLGRWDDALEQLRRAVILDPRNVGSLRSLAKVLLYTRRWSEARQVLDRGLALAPDDLLLILRKAQTFLGEGDLTGARGLLKEAQGRVEPTALVANMASFYDLGWVLDSEQTTLLRRLTPTAFDDDEGAWAICQAQACAFAGDAACTRDFAERAREAFEVRLRATPDDPGLLAAHFMALAYLGRKEEAIRDAEHASALWPLMRDAFTGPFVRHQLARVYILAGQQEKAIDVLESLLKIPYFLSPGWLKIDPNFDPLRKNPRFQKLVAGS